jgi:hypothetical protein
MNYELKKVRTVDAVRTNEDGTKTQDLVITVGVVGCPYSDITADSTVKYIFENTQTVLEVEQGIATFAQAWVAENYPATE